MFDMDGIAEHLMLDLPHEIGLNSTAITVVFNLAFGWCIALTLASVLQSASRRLRL
jgi:hypothetical protein